MFAIGISLVKNEEDIIETFIRWNLKFLDGLIIADNGSTDGTRDILDAMMHEGLPVVKIEDNEFSHFQSEKTTNLLHRAGTIFPSKFIIPLDADELIESHSSDEFRSVLNSIPEGYSGSWQWKTYLPSPEILKASTKFSSLDQFTFHREIEQPPYCKTIIRVSDQNILDLVVPKGNHILKSPQPMELKKIDIPLAHFPIRSREQVLKQTILTLMGRAREDRIKNIFNKQDGYQLFVILDRILTGQKVTDADVLNLALNYAQLPGKLAWPTNVQETPHKFFYIEPKYKSLIQGNDPMIDFLRNFMTLYSDKEQIFDPSDYYLLEGKEEIDPDSTAFDPNWFTKNIYLDIAPFNYFQERFGPESAIDFGCGLGSYIRLLNNFGVKKVFGIDNFSPNIFFVPPENYLKHDLSKPLALNEKFDLAICFEVIEHLIPGYDDILLDTIENHAKGLILFSAAAPGQPGKGHINCQPFDYWAEKWSARGWAPHVFETLSFRALASFSWARGNPVILFKTEDQSECQKKWLELKRAHNYDHWYYHKPLKVIDNPLFEPIPNPENVEPPEPEENQAEISENPSSDPEVISRPPGRSLKHAKKFRRSLTSILKRFGLNTNDKDLLLIKSSDLFDESFYSGSNPDILHSNMDPAYHYLLFGGFEGRDPSKLFSSNSYLEINPDVKEAGINPLVHYLKFGKKNRNPEP